MKIKLSMLCLAGLFFGSCNPKVIPPVYDVKKDLTAGAISLLESYKKLLTDTPLCIANTNGRFYSVASTMPADQYNTFTTQYQGKTTSFVSMFGSFYPDYIRNIWECTTGGITYYGACPPSPLVFPYPCDGNHTDAVYYVKFVPVDSLKIKILDTIWNVKHLISGIPLANVKTIISYSLEDAKGYIGTTYPKLYNCKYSALGIVCNIRLKSNQTVACYLVANDMKPTYPDIVNWKINQTGVCP